MCQILKDTTLHFLCGTLNLATILTLCLLVPACHPASTSLPFVQQLRLRRRHSINTTHLLMPQNHTGLWWVHNIKPISMLLYLANPFMKSFTLVINLHTSRQLGGTRSGSTQHQIWCVNSLRYGMPHRLQLAMGILMRWTTPQPLMPWCVQHHLINDYLC